jgi:hypothetical protein
MTTNGKTAEATEPKAPTLLDMLDKEYASKGKADPKAVKAALTDWEQKRAAKVAASEALEKAMTAESDASAALIRLVGRKQFNYKNTVYIPMSKGNRAWIRPQSSEETRELG